MTDARKLANHFLDLPSEARAPATRLLRQIAHDVQTPLSTLAMEVFSTRLLLTKLDPSNSASPSERSKALSSLSEIFANMERASSQISEYLNQLTSLGTDGLESSELGDAPKDDERSNDAGR